MRAIQPDLNNVFPPSKQRSSTRHYFSSARFSALLLTREIVEKSLLDELRLQYCTPIRLRFEPNAMRLRLLAVHMKRYERPIEAEKIMRVPRNLDLTPYHDQKASRYCDAW